MDPVEIHDVGFVHEGDGYGDDDVLKRKMDPVSEVRSGCEVVCLSGSDVSSNAVTTGEEIASFRNLWRRKRASEATEENA